MESRERMLQAERRKPVRFLVQRVSSAEVSVEGDCVGRIGRGFLVFVGISGTDTAETADRMVKKLIGLRILRDENGKTNLDLKAVDGSLLLISQFTLYADCRKGNRPSFVNAGAPEMANSLYRYIIDKCRGEIAAVEEGSFGADMKVSLTNDGPFTVILDSDEIMG